MISFWGLVRGNNVLFRVQVRVKSIIKVSVFLIGKLLAEKHVFFKSKPLKI